MSARATLDQHDRAVCIVRYLAGFDYRGAPPVNPGVLHQVTLRRDKVSGEHIRLGETPGDELSGWQWLDALEVVGVLGILQDDGTTVRPCA